VGGEGAHRHVAREIAAVADRPLDDTLFRSTVVETLDSELTWTPFIWGD